jgi:hypothetical protein
MIAIPTMVCKGQAPVLLLFFIWSEKGYDLHSGAVHDAQ